MENDKSDFAPMTFASLGRSARKWTETAAVLLGLIGGGMGLGFWGGLQYSETAHVAEIDRMREVYRSRLVALTGKVTEAADTAGTAAMQAEAAAVTAKQAAKTVKEIKK